MSPGAGTAAYVALKNMICEESLLQVLISNSAEVGRVEHVNFAVVQVLGFPWWELQKNITHKHPSVQYVPKPVSAALNKGSGSRLSSQGAA